MLIRVEIPVDAPAIDQLLRRGFPSSAEAVLVKELRKKGLITLGMVAVDEEGHLIGYVAYSPVTLKGEDKLWVGLAPLVVSPEWQNKGVGKALIRESLDTLNELSYALVITLGEPNYYQKLGFTPAKQYRLSCRWPGTEEHLQLYPLEGAVLAGEEGEVEYAEPFLRL